jgi:hypothetical protein
MSTALHLFPADLHAPVLSGEQFVRAQFDPPKRLSGAQRLLLATIEDALMLRAFALRFPKNVKAQRQREQDERWVNGEEAPILFHDACALLHLPADVVRKHYFAVNGTRAKHKASLIG